MKIRTVVFGCAVAILVVGMAVAGEGVNDSQLGLSKESVYETPDPIVPVTSALDPGDNERLGAYFSESPPLIPHLVGDFLPIRVGENVCIDCHELRDEIGKEIAAGDPTPMPPSHYTDLRREGAKMGTEVVGARFVCTQCHVPQTDARPLVDSTYQQ